MMICNECILYDCIGCEVYEEIAIARGIADYEFDEEDEDLWD